MDCLHLITYSRYWETHYNDIIMGLIESQTVYSDADQRKQSSASLAFVRGMHRSPVNSPHKGPVTRKMFPCDDVVMVNANTVNWAMYSWYIVQDLYLHSKCTGDTAILP